MMPLHHCVSQLRPTRLCENVAESATTMTVWPDDSFAPTYQPRVRHRGQRNTSATKSGTWLSPEAVACDLVQRTYAAGQGQSLWAVFPERLTKGVCGTSSATFPDGYPRGLAERPVSASNPWRSRIRHVSNERRGNPSPPFC